MQRERESHIPAPAPSHVGGTQLWLGYSRRPLGVAPSHPHLLLICSGCLLSIAIAQSLRADGGGRSAAVIALLLAASVGAFRYQAVTHLLPADHIDRVGRFGAEAVSYSQLTLPTRCSV